MDAAGSNVRTIRQQVGMSLRAVAEAAGLDPSTLSRVENGKTQLTGDLAQKLASVLHVSAGMFFSDPAVIEGAMLRMRKAPLLTPAALLTWRGPDGFEECPDQEYLHTAIGVASRYAFALQIEDEANMPILHAGDKVIFDARREPKRGDLAVSQNPSGKIWIGQYRPPALDESNEAFALIPANRLYQEVGSERLQLILRGVLVELRRYF